MASLRDLLDEFKKGVGNFGDAIQQPFRDRYVPDTTYKVPSGPVRQKWQPSVQTRFYQGLEPVQHGVNFLERLGANPGKTIPVLKPIEDTVNVFGRRSMDIGAKLYPQIYNNKRIQDAKTKTFGKDQSLLRDAGDVFGGASTIAGAFNPALVAGYSAFGTGIRSGADLLQGKRPNLSANIQQSFKEGVPMAGATALLPIDKLNAVQKLPTKFRLPLKSGANVLQGLGVDTAAKLETTPESVAIDALFPIAGEAIPKILRGMKVSKQEAKEINNYFKGEPRVNSEILGKLKLNSIKEEMLLEQYDRIAKRLSDNEANGVKWGRRAYIKAQEGIKKQIADLRRESLQSGKVNFGEIADAVKGKEIDPRYGNAKEYAKRYKNYQDFVNSLNSAGAEVSSVNVRKNQIISNITDDFGSLENFWRLENGKEPRISFSSGKLGIKSQPTLKPQIDPLIQEAKKYKSAEELQKQIDLERSINQNVTKIQKDFIDGKISMEERKKLANNEFARGPQYNQAKRVEPTKPKLQIKPNNRTQLVPTLKGKQISLNRNIAQLENPQSVSQIPGGITGAKGMQQPEQLSLVSRSSGNNTPPLNNLEQMELPKKMRKFPQTVIKSDKTPLPVKEEIAGRYSSYYNPITNKETVDFVNKNILSKGEDYALGIARNGQDTNANATAMLLIEKYIKNNEFEKANDLISSVSTRFTKQGQAIQILSLYNRLTPEGALRYAQTIVDKANAGKKENLINIKPQQAKDITDTASRMQKATGRERDLLTAELIQKIKNLVPAGIGQKLSTIQAMAQLLNPKTAVRNIFGNAAFQVGENLSNTVATPIDIATSLFTGKRTRTLPNPIAQTKGFVTGLKEGAQEAIRGVDTMPDVRSQFDLKGNVFKNPILKTLEKAMSLELRATDRAFYKSAVEDSLSQQMRLAKAKVPTKEMIEQAHLDGLYRTFQDENYLSWSFSNLKKGLNGGKDFGVGDLVLKYPKTPASLLMRGVEYSPANFARTIYEMARPLTGRSFNQREFVDSFSRALVGTGGLMTTGIILEKLGIITGKREKDSDINSVQSYAGLGQYKINISALKRFALSGMNPDEAGRREGDTLVTYDWIQPFAIGLSMGANISQNGGKVSDSMATILNSLQGGVETLAEQPLVSGLQRAFGGYGSQGFISALTETIKGTPASFVPTSLSQINQLMDNTKRVTQDPNPINESLNLAKNKIPGLAQTLPEQYNIYGEPNKRYQAENNNAFNVFLNPAFVSKVKNDPVNDEVLRIYEQTGEKTQAPRIVDNKITINGQTKELTGEEVSTYQKYVGTLSKQVFNDLISNPEYKNLPDIEKTKRMQSILTDINAVAKIELFGNTPPKNLSKSAKLLLAGRPELLAPYNISKSVDSILENAGLKKGGKKGKSLSTIVKEGLSMPTTSSKLNISKKRFSTKEVYNKYLKNIEAKKPNLTFGK